MAHVKVQTETANADRSRIAVLKCTAPVLKVKPYLAAWNPNCKMRAYTDLLLTVLRCNLYVY